MLTENWWVYTSSLPLPSLVTSYVYRVRFQLKIDELISACRIDVCSYKADFDASREAACHNIEAFAEECTFAGFPVPVWRSEDFCGEHLEDLLTINLFLTLQTYPMVFFRIIFTAQKFQNDHAYYFANFYSRGVFGRLQHENDFKYKLKNG